MQSIEMSGRLRESIKRNLRNRSDNDNLRYAAEGKILQQEYNEDFEDKYLQERPELLDRKLTREAEFRTKRSLLEDQAMEEYLKKNPELLDKIVERELLQDEKKREVRKRLEEARAQKPPAPAGVVPALEPLVTPATKQTRARGRARGAELFEPEPAPAAPRLGFDDIEPASMTKRIARTQKRTARYSPIAEDIGDEELPARPTAAAPAPARLNNDGTPDMRFSANRRLVKPAARPAGAASASRGDQAAQQLMDAVVRSVPREDRALQKAIDAVERAYPRESRAKKLEIAQMLVDEGRF